MESIFRGGGIYSVFLQLTRFVLRSIELAAPIFGFGDTPVAGLPLCLCRQYCQFSLSSYASTKRDAGGTVSLFVFLFCYIVG